MPPGSEQDCEHSGEDDARLRRLLRFSHIFSASVQEIIGDRYLSESSDHPLTLPQMHLLKLISNNGGHKVSDAAALLGVSSPAATKCIDKLERLGLLARAPCRTDRRATILKASQDGRTLVREYERIRKRRLMPLIEGFSPLEVDRLTDLLERFAVALFKQEGFQRTSCLRCGGYVDNDCAIARVQGSCPYQQLRADSSTEMGIS
jgi:DNA-binding MarR family transcriptional regulator